MHPPTIVFLALAAGGCAHHAARSAQTPSATLTAYRAVRSGAQLSASAGGYRYCATPRGLDVVTTTASDSSQWNDVTRDREIESGVRGVLQRDPQLRDQNIQVETTAGEVLLSGQVASDAQAVRAIEETARVDGVVFVNAALTSPESPGPAARRQNPDGRCLL